MEPKSYFDPPCEREWTIAELEEFFAGIDAVTGPCNRTLPYGIYVTNIVPPEQGWPIAMYCPICKETTFILSPWAAKPKDGDYFKMNNICARDERHNMIMAMTPPLYRKPTQEDYSELIRRMSYGPYDMEITQELTVEEAKKRYPNTPIPRQDNE